MSGFFRKPKYSTIKQVQQRKEIPEGLWQKCQNCLESIHRQELEEHHYVCPKCGYHERLTCVQRLALLVDDGSFTELDMGLTSADPLGFHDGRAYGDKVAAARKKTGLNEAVVCGEARIGGHRVALAVMDFRFRGGSMGSVVGEKVTRCIEYGAREGVPVIIVNSSGGARMEEGMLSLMQMAKTAAALARLRQQGRPYIAILTNPTTGGVTASFASLGDVILAEPGAYIGFAGKRVIEQTMKQDLPKGFQTAEFLLDKGLVDRIVHRQQLRGELIELLGFLTPGEVAVAAANARQANPTDAEEGAPESSEA